MVKEMVERLERRLAVYWLPVSATLAGQGLAIRVAAEARGYMAAGGEILFIPMMYMAYRMAKALPGIIERAREMGYGHEHACRREPGVERR